MVEAITLDGMPRSPHHAYLLSRRTATEPSHTNPVISDYLEAIDEAASGNLYRFTPNRFPGVGIPYEVVHVNAVIEKVFAKRDIALPQVNPQEPTEQKIIVARGGIARPPDGDPVQNRDVDYYHFFNSLPTIVDALAKGQTPPKVTIVKIASANGSLGKLTQDWNDGLREHGLAQYRETYAELLEPMLPTSAEGLGENGDIQLHGISLGSTTIKGIEQYFPALQDKFWILRDTPPAPYSRLKWLHQAQMLTGAYLEHAIRARIDPRVRGVKQANSNFFSEVLPQRKPSRLGKEAWLIDAGLVLGRELSEEELTEGNTLVVDRHGLFDPIDPSVRRIARFAKGVWESKRGRNQPDTLAPAGVIFSAPDTAAALPYDELPDPVRRVAGEPYKKGPVQVRQLGEKHYAVTVRATHTMAGSVYENVAAWKGAVEKANKLIAS